MAKKILRFSLILLLLGVVSLTTFLATLYLGGFGKIPSKLDLQNWKNETATEVLASNNKVIGKFFTENRTNVPYDSLPSHLIQALIATEDARFYSHEGVDAIAMLRVLVKTILLQDRSAGGGSTLSQQLAKNLFGRKDYGKISILVNKLKEIILANRLEEIYSKEEIIELYFNTVPFGENTYGIEVAAQRFFSKPVHLLKIEEAAVLVGMLKANTYYNPRLNPDHALARRNTVIALMQQNQVISKSEKDSLIQLELDLNYKTGGDKIQASYFLNQVEKELQTILKQKGLNIDYKSEGLKVYTSIDFNLQQSAAIAMKRHLSKMQNYLDRLMGNGSSKRKLDKLVDKIAARNKLEINSADKKQRALFYWHAKAAEDSISLRDSLRHVLKQLHAGILGIHPQTGAILCWQGGIDFSHYPFDQILAKRQLASTFKPFLYAQALENGRGLCDYLSNEPIVLNDYDNWSPQNYDKESGGNYALGAALAFSKNLPTVHLYFETEYQQLAAFWSSLGFMDELNKEPSVILGTNSVSMLELANAYAAFANGGRLIQNHCINRIEDAEGNLIFQREHHAFPKVMEKHTADQINEALSMAINRGTGTAIRSNYRISIPLAGKTGTSQDYADAWFVAYNAKLLLVSRVGATYPSIHFNSGAYGSGSKLALPLIGICLQEALRDPSFRKEMYAAQLDQSASYYCEDFKEANIIDGLFEIFRRKDNNLEQERKRAKKKKKVKGFFNSLFGKND